MCSRGHTQSEAADLCQEESLFETVLSGPQPIVTLLVAKPDVLRRNLGKLLKRLSHDGFALVGARLVVLSTEQADVVIPTEDKEVGDDIFFGYRFCVYQFTDIHLLP